MFFSSNVISQFSSSFASISSIIPIRIRSSQETSFFEVFSIRSFVSNDLPSLIKITGLKTRPALQFMYNLFVAPSSSGVCNDIPTCGSILLLLRSVRNDKTSSSPSGK